MISKHYLDMVEHSYKLEKQIMAIESNKYQY